MKVTPPKPRHFGDGICTYSKHELEGLSSMKWEAKKVISCLYDVQIGLIVFSYAIKQRRGKAID